MRGARRTVQVLALPAAAVVFAVVLADDNRIPRNETCTSPPPAEWLLEHAGVKVTPSGLVAALSHERPEIRDVAAQVLGERRIDVARPALRAIATDVAEGMGTRIAAAGALLDMGDTSGVPMLLGANAPAPGPFASFLAVRAAMVLAEHGNPAGFDTVVRLARGQGKPDGTRTIAVNALPRFFGFPGKRQLAVDVLSALVAGDPDTEVRQAAVVALSNFQGKDMDGAMERAQEDSDPMISGVAAGYLHRAGWKPQPIP